MDIQSTGTKRLVDICETLGADEYFSGSSGKNYMDTSLFEEKEISISYQDYSHPTYSQQYSDFTSHLSIIDLLMNHGPSAKNILLDGNVAV
jgi:hypothetical protein